MASGSNQSTASIPIPETFEGEYRIDGGQWQPLSQEALPELSAYDGELTARLRFDYEVAQGARLNFYLDHIGYRICINGELYMESATMDAGFLTDICGSRWEYILSPGITPEDEVEITLANPHRYGNGNAYMEFFSNLYIGPDNNQILAGYLEPFGRPIRIVALVMPIYVTMVDMVYCDGDELICNLSYVIQVVGNILSSIILCRVMGIAGVSLGSVIGCVLSMSMLIIHFFRKCSSLRFAWFISFKTLSDVVKFSMVDAGMYLFLAIQLLVFNKLIIHNFGSEYLPVLTVVTSLVEMTVIFDGLGQALEPLVAVYNGEGNTKGISASMKIAGKLAVIEGIAATVMVLVFAGLFVRLFGVSDPVLVSMAKTAVRIVAFSMPFASLCFLFTSYFLLLKRIGLAFFISMLNNLILPLMLAVPLGIIAGINGIWAGIMLSYILTVAGGALIVYRIKGELTFPLLIDPAQDQKVCIFNDRITEKDIIDMRDRAEAFLKEKKVQERTIMNVMLIIEDACLLIGEKNKGKTVTCECTLITGDEITMILRDDGVIFDITDADAHVSSLRQYVVAGIMEKQEIKKYLKTSGLNRNVFRFEG